MPETVMSADGRLTIPLEIRKAVNAAPGTRFLWVLHADGYLQVIAKTATLEDLAGMLQPRTNKRVSIEDMNPFR